MTDRTQPQPPHDPDDYRADVLSWMIATAFWQELDSRGELDIEGIAALVRAEIVAEMAKRAALVERLRADWRIIYNLGGNN